MSGNIRFAVLSGVVLALAAAQAYAQPYGGNGLNTPRAAGTSSAATAAAPKPAPLTLSAGEGDKRLNEWKVYGRYQFTETWGAELNYSDWGKRGAQGQTVAPEAVPRGSHINLAATGTVPITQGLSLYGKLGYGRNEITGSPYCLSAACGPLAGGRSQGTRAGVGVRYSFSDNWGLRLDYENVNSLSTPNELPAKGDSWSARIKYTF